MSATTQTEKAPKSGKSGKLEDQAATAALYVTSNKKDSKGTGTPGILDADGKLSSASAATSLKYAKPHELPSFPVVGINQESSAGAAASLAAANQKPFEHWKPEYSQPANKAALLAKDYRPAPLWQPEASSAGSKAAYLAATGGTKVDTWKPDPTAEGNSAAGQAMRGKSTAPNVDYGYTKEGSSKALLAATGAFSGKQSRPAPAPSTEPLYPDAMNSAANALKAATKAHRPGSSESTAFPNDLPGLSSEDADRIHKAAVTNLDRQMYTNNPLVAPEVEERNREAALRGAAVTMANKMYETAEKQRQQKGALQAASSANRQAEEEASQGKIKEAAKNYLTLQETAQKLAEQRLSKLHDENEEYRKHYGFASQPKSRMSLRGRRVSQPEEARDVSDSDDEDRRLSSKIRNQMSGLNKQVQDVDARKRQKDRDSLLQAARRNVDKNMAHLDERVFQDTGKASPAMQADWDSKARAKAEAESTARLQNHGKVAIGGGKYMDQSEIEAIAAGRVQPTLDEATARAEERRAADEARRQAIEEERRTKQEKAADDRERTDKTKVEWKRFKAEEKEEKQQRKDAEKAERAHQKAEEKRLRDEQLRSINEQDIKRPEDRDSKRKSTLLSLASPFKSKRESKQAEGTAGATSAGAAGGSRRSSTSLESSDDEAGAAVAAHSSEFKGKEKATESTPASAPGVDIPKRNEAGSSVAIPASTTETTVTGGTKDEFATKEKATEKEKEKEKKPSWFKRLSRHTSRKVQPEDLPKQQSTTEIASKEPTKDTDKDIVEEEPSTSTTSGQTGLTPVGIPASEIPQDPNIHPEIAEPRDEQTKDPNVPVPPINSDAPVMSATINPAEDSAISPVEADAVAARGEFEDQGLTSQGPKPSEPMPRASGSTELTGEGDLDSPRGRTNTQGVSPLGKVDTNVSGTDDFQEAKEAQDTVNTTDLPIPAFPATRGSMESPHRETRFREEL